MLSRLFRIHTLGVGHRSPERQLLLKTDGGTVQIHLGPTSFLTANNVAIEKGDTLEVTGREVRKADSTWTLRDATGHPLWISVQPETREFWTAKKVLLTVVVVKVVALATVLRH